MEASRGVAAGDVLGVREQAAVLVVTSTAGRRLLSFGRARQPLNLTPCASRRTGAPGKPGPPD
jgi:hypothetical protein